MKKYRLVLFTAILLVYLSTTVFGQGPGSGWWMRGTGVLIGFSPTAGSLRTQSLFISTSMGILSAVGLENS